MSSTLGGAIKSYIEGLGLGLTAFTDAVPPRAQLQDPKTGLLKAPYVVITGDIGMTLDQSEDAAAATGTEEIQLDLYQVWRDSADKVLESPTLANALTRGIHHAQLPASGSFGAPDRVFAMLQRHRQRRLDRDQRIVRHIYQVDVRRAI